MTATAAPKKKTKTKKAQLRITLGTFDTQIPNLRIKYHGKPIKKVNPLSTEDYSPHGGTPLNDSVIEMTTELQQAVNDHPNDTHIGLLADESGSMGHLQGAVIEGFNKFVDELRDDEVKNKGKVLLVIFTDGYENSSVRDRDGRQVKQLIAERENEGWKFLYLGANQDAWAAGTQLGTTGYVQNFAATSRGTSDAFKDVTLASAAHLVSDSAYETSNKQRGNIKAGKK